MAFPLVPVAIGTAVAIALGYGLMKASGAKVPSPDAAKKARDAVLSKGYDAGRLEGAADGKADAGKAHDPRPVLNYSTDAEVQKSYENGYNDGYESSWVAPPTVDVVHDSTPSAGGASKGMSAYDYGYSRGRSTGYKDGIDGKDADMKSPLETSGSLKRQAESGNPAEYRRGYADGYRVGYVKGIEKASEGSVSIITSGVGRDSYVSVGAWGTRNAVLAVRRKIGGSSTPADKARAEYNQGERDGSVYCEKRWDVGFGSRSPEEIRDLIGRLRPSDAVTVMKLLDGRSEDYKRGFLAGKEACEKKHWAALSPAPAGWSFRGVR